MDKSNQGKFLVQSNKYGNPYRVVLSYGPRKKK